MRKFFLGTLTLIYFMLKVYKSCLEKSSQGTSDPKDNDEEKKVDETSDKQNSLERSNKRNIEETEGRMKILKPRFNFFLGFQVYDTEIHRKVKRLQELVVAQNPKLHSALVNVSTLHITLAVTHLANKTEIKFVKEKLDEWADKNLKILFKEPMILNFTGVKTFGDVVAYVDIVNCENYKKLCDVSLSINNLLSSAGFSTSSKFTPHLTILKLSKDYKLLKLKKKFKEDFESLKKCQDHFGKQEVSHIQLLSMDDQKDVNGYYNCLHQINIKDIIMNEDHSECCSPIPKPKNNQNVPFQTSKHLQR